MRYWDPVRNPDRRRTRQRTVVRGVRPTAQFGQRPMFSRADEEQEPSGGPDSGLASEARLDDLVPADEGPGSVTRESVTGDDYRISTYVRTVTDNVSATPTEAEIIEAFGHQESGFVGAIVDGGGAGKVWLCMKYLSYWHYVGMTRAT